MKPIEIIGRGFNVKKNELRLRRLRKKWELNKDKNTSISQEDIDNAEPLEGSIGYELLNIKFDDVFTDGKFNYSNKE